MAKIVAVHCGEKPQSLLQQIDEANFLSKLAKKITGQTADSSPNANKSQAPTPEEPEVGRAFPTGTTTSGALTTLVGEVMDIAGNETRFVVYLNHGALTKHYLVTGGGSSLIDTLSDDEIKAIAEQKPVTEGSAASVKIVEFAPNFTFANLLKIPKNQTQADRAVLINAPKKLVAELHTVGENVEQAKAVLKRLMSHKIYVLTLNLPKAGKPEILSSMKAGNSTDEMAAGFNPDVIENYPNRALLVQARDEWKARTESAPRETTPDEEREAAVSKKEKEAKWAERERAADAQLSGDATGMSQLISRLAKAEDADKAAETLKGWARSNKTPLPDLEAELKKLSVNLHGALEKLKSVK